MTTTQKQRLFWGGAVALAVIYFAPPLFVPVHRDALSKAAKPSTTTLPSPSATPHPMPPDPADGLTGIWQGNAVVPGNGICSLKLEIRKNASKPAKFAGYPTLGCMAVPFVPKAQSLSDLSKLSPASVILTGASALGTIKFGVEKQIGSPANACSITSLTATPFGTDQLAAEWQEGTCQGGNMMLRRIGR